MRYDLYYIKNRSLWLDLTIIVRTFAIMLIGSGSSRVRSRISPRRASSALATDLDDAALTEPMPVPIPVYDTTYVAGETTKVAEVAR
jgi:hypothetical protein